MIALQLEDPFINAQGEPDLAQFKTLLNLQNVSNELGSIIEEHPSNIRQQHALKLLNNPKFANLKYIASVLFLQFRDIKQCRRWLLSGRPEWLGESPMDLIKAGRIEHVARYLKQSTNPKGMSFGG